MAVAHPPASLPTRLSDGNLSSPLFGTSNSIHAFGPGGASANRTIDLQMRLSF
ncbi:MAG TPA: hypothetical protein VGS10_20455 [Terracidiphilus sp.]|nr:hypothetical protein [Terracidiphilus sp.]